MARKGIAWGRVVALSASTLVSTVVMMGAWSVADYAWAQVAGPDIEQGRAVYGRWCSHCHDPGPGHPGTQSLAIKYGDTMPSVLEERDDLTPEVVELFVRQGVMSMAGFRKTEITDEELAALAAYLVQAHTE